MLQPTAGAVTGLPGSNDSAGAAAAGLYRLAEFRQSEASLQVVLRVVRGHLLGKLWLLPPGKFVIGRAAECQIRLAVSAVSRRHCILCVTEKGASVRDLGSRNRTGLNGQTIQAERQLNHGDSLSVCGTTFAVQISLINAYDLFDPENVSYDDFDGTMSGPPAFTNLLR